MGSDDVEVDNIVFMVIVLIIYIDIMVIISTMFICEVIVVDVDGGIFVLIYVWMKEIDGLSDFIGGDSDILYFIFGSIIFIVKVVCIVIVKDIYDGEMIGLDDVIVINMEFVIFVVVVIILGTNVRIIMLLMCYVEVIDDDGEMFMVIYVWCNVIDDIFIGMGEVFVLSISICFFGD